MKNRLQTLTITALAALLALPVMASVVSPVSLTLTSTDPARRGEPATIVAVIVSGDELAQATFDVPQQAQWHLLDGATQWTGALHKDQRLELTFRVMPLTDEPEPLLAAVTPLRQSRMIASIDARRMNGQTPEVEVEDAEPQPGPPSAAEMEAARKEAVRARKDTGSRSAAVQLTVTGRLVFRDQDSLDKPLRHAKVQLINRAMDVFDPIEQVCRTGSTDGNGNFSLTGSCDDIVNGPDVAVRVVLDNDTVRVKPDGAVQPLNNGTYTFQVNSTVNFGGGTIALGLRRITTNTGAFRLHNLITRAAEFMADETGETVPKVTLLFPAPLTITMRVGAFGVNLNEIRIKGDVPFQADAIAVHEYGHHIMFNLAEFPFPDYQNGVCDDVLATLPFLEVIEPGHCFWKPEKDEISFSDGFPDYFAAMVHHRHVTEDNLTAPRFYRTDIETRRADTFKDDYEFAGQEDHVEGFIAAILWDLTDSDNDDQEDLGAGQRDNITISFGDLWDVIRNFDPDTNDGSHNHPVDIHELWRGFKARMPEKINLISEAYREHRILKPLPDLTVSSVQNPPSSLARGASFSNTNTVSNASGTGSEVAVNGFTVRFRLVNATTTLTLGTRTVPANLGVGRSNEANTTLVVPPTAAPGNYNVQVCADTTGQVPEANETNNCRVSAGTVRVQ